MAYSLLEQHSRDLDIFLSDRSKLIHIASAGGSLPKTVLDSDVYNDNILTSLSQIDSNLSFEVDINPNLVEILDLNENEIENYIKSFVEMASKGFYSYDKTRICNFEDQTFHLVAKPSSPTNPNILFENYELNENLIISILSFPNDYQLFNLSEYV